MTDYIPEPIKNLGIEAKEIILERLKNPFINLYLFFLIIYNWDIILYLLFSKDIIELKIQCAKNYYHDGHIWWLLNWRFIAPLIYSIVSNYILQIFSLVNDYLNAPLILKRYEKFCHSEKQMYNEYKEVIKVRTENKEKEDFEREIKNLMNKNEVLQFENEELTEKLKNNLEITAERRIESISPINKLPINLDHRTRKIILDMIFEDLKIPIKESSGSFNLIEYIIQELHRKEPFDNDDFVNVLYEGVNNLFLLTEDYEDFKSKEFMHRNTLEANSEKILHYLDANNYIKLDELQSSIRGKRYYDFIKQ